MVEVKRFKETLRNFDSAFGFSMLPKDKALKMLVLATLDVMLASTSPAYRNSPSPSPFRARHSTETGLDKVPEGSRSGLVSTPVLDLSAAFDR